MTAFLAMGAAVLTNMLALLGMAFLLSRGFGLLRTRPERERKAILGVAFGVMAIGSAVLILRGFMKEAAAWLERRGS